MQFSAAKSAAEAKLLQAAVYDDDKKIKSFSQFKKDANEITDIVQNTWLRVEYDMAKRQSVQSESFNRMRDDADLYPFWIYKGMMDDREREDHVEMEDQVFSIGDPAGDACFPPNDWNCRCEGDSIDGDEVDDKGYSVNSNAQAKGFLDSDVDEQFRFNPADQGMLPKTGSYFDVMANANKGDAKLFGLDNIYSDDQLEGLGSRFHFAVKGLHAIIETVNGWRDKYHVDAKYNIVFQNEELLTNVRFNNNSLHAIQKHSRGFENIPDTIADPDEVWQFWQSDESQKVVCRNYIKYGSTCYIVQVINGYVSDAFAVSKLQANKYRKGVIA